MASSRRRFGSSMKRAIQVENLRPRSRVRADASARDAKSVEGEKGGREKAALPAEPVVHPVLHDREQPGRDSTCERGIDVLSEADESLEDDNKGGEEGAGPDRVEGGAVQVR